MLTGKLHRIVFVGAAIMVCLSLGAALGLRRNIQSDLDRWAATAQAAHPHPGDDVAALLDFIQSDTHPLDQRNHAVWALGQARDGRAVPVLSALHDGGECDHAHRLCQRELDKALALCRGEGLNLLCIRANTPDDVVGSP